MRRATVVVRMEDASTGTTVTSTSPGTDDAGVWLPESVILWSLIFAALIDIWNLALLRGACI